MGLLFSLKYLYRCIFALLIVAIPVVSAAEGELKRGEIAFAEALYADHEGRALRSVEMARLAEEQKRLGGNALEANLYIAEKYQQQGFALQAMAWYRHIAETANDKKAVERAWLAVAKLAIDHGEFDTAAEALANTGKRLNKTQKTEQAVARVLLFLRSQAPEKAIAAMPRFKNDSLWSLYQRYNIAAILLSHYRNKQGALIFAALGKMDVMEDAERKALRDQANLALGYSLLQLEKPSKAKKYLKKVSLDSLVSNQALLGMGWAYSAENDLERALIHWLEIQNRSAISTYYYESMLAAPYGFARAQAYGQAADAYETAINRFEGDINAMAIAKEAIRRGALAKLLGVEPGDEFAWAEAEFSDADIAYFVPLLLESPRFQREVRRYRSLLRLNTVHPSLQNELSELKNNEQVADAIAPVQARYDALSKKFIRMIQSAEDELKTLALMILESHQAQLKDYTQQARFGLARVIEQAMFGD